ncbi:hypothetical protein [Bradyrhizobium liaoningense]|uniref:hypothetical protein n=1 Tax=Bradyrhizobium liaoningense TaxID=43992 RepID=UPI001BA6C9EB|nr:hypothetical protein [Bradyrhizobium liaoningense]MBR0719706.1 hypothetical protein [Bradyrhizobium liaoningense]
MSAPTWKVGQRVARPSSNELGTVVEITRDQMKIKWDSGTTSYHPPNVQATTSAARYRSRQTTEDKALNIGEPRCDIPG